MRDSERHSCTRMSIAQGVVMSTKSSLTYCVDEATGTSAHLFEECLAPVGFPVFLELSGLTEVSIDVTPQGSNLTIAIPRELAMRLGLVPISKSTQA